ncbi:hypothetical protein DO021_16060 [Desulfobacter hydrogenophilus]|uniref:Uncharacterized protein n=1 Tax=Desulfobacter hydrogenophilus TaxID=2291 RepID=A0A328FC48_9BACT|nr:hypothetical protein [Desulfobacter hydrogenophilus]NDY73958.1 hypothetical protein [Desulfobacter hydrogenophilus]QBH14647.1 hypothetical protein EYB58_17980 [Desulfobacter hydrogenophilus]RAM00992.1 hypothetical protein DO021_16060 [Desulfobacter hydrogenophilus]
METNPAIAKPIILVVIALTLFMLPGLKLPYLDQKAETYFSEAITKAGLAYSVCRIVNASVSVIKESQIQIEPAGLGVSLAAGQALDPLDDMTERASDIIVTAIVSLGIQKIAYELSVEFAPVLIAIFLIAFVIATILKSVRAKTIRDIILKSIVLIAVARLCLPTASIISSYLNGNYFSPEIIKVKDELAMSYPVIERLKDVRMPEINGVLGTVKNGFNFVGEKTADLKTSLKEMIQNMGSMVSNLLKLSSLYVALFVIQVVLLPVGIFWLLSRITNAFLWTNRF